jgi:hypothetical protein
VVIAQGKNKMSLFFVWKRLGPSRMITAPIDNAKELDQRVVS